MHPLNTIMAFEEGPDVDTIAKHVQEKFNKALSNHYSKELQDDHKILIKIQRCTSCGIERALDVNTIGKSKAANVCHVCLTETMVTSDVTREITVANYLKETLENESGPATYLLVTVAYPEFEQEFLMSSINSFTIHLPLEIAAMIRDTFLGLVVTKHYPSLIAQMLTALSLNKQNKLIVN